MAGQGEELRVARKAILSGGNETRLELVKARLDIVSLLEDLNLTHIDDRGDEVWARCPFHDDNKPSWSMNADLGGDRWGFHSCFVCREAGVKRGKGNVVTLVRDVLGLQSYREALGWLENYVGLSGDPSDLMDASLDVRLKRSEARSGDRQARARMKMFSAFKPLEEGGKGWQYLLSRGVTATQIRERGVRWGTGRYAGRVVFPIKDGPATVNFYARHVGNGTPKGLYAKGKGTIGAVLYGYEFSNPLLKVCYIVEGVFDVLAVERALTILGAAESKNVFATNGATLLESQAKLLRPYETVVVIPDMKGKARSLVPSSKALLPDHELLVVEVPRGCDPGDAGDSRLAQLLATPYNLRRKLVMTVVDYAIKR